MENVISRVLNIQAIMGECPRCGKEHVFISQDFAKKQLKCKACGFACDPEDWPQEDLCDYQIVIGEEDAKIVSNDI